MGTYKKYKQVAGWESENSFKNLNVWTDVTYIFSVFHFTCTFINKEKINKELLQRRISNGHEEYNIHWYLTCSGLNNYISKLLPSTFQLFICKGKLYCILLVSLACLGLIVFLLAWLCRIILWEQQQWGNAYTAHITEYSQPTGLGHIESRMSILYSFKLYIQNCLA